MSSQQLPLESITLTIRLTLTAANQLTLLDESNLFRPKRPTPAPHNASNEAADAERLLTLTFACPNQEPTILTLYAKEAVAQAVTLAEGKSKLSDASPLATRSTLAVDVVDQQSRKEPEQICDDVEHALCHLHNTAQLAQNPLLQFINLEPWAPTAREQLHSPARALKQLLNEVITTISGVDAGQKLTPTQWRLDHYLHLRYRLGIQHKDLAARLGYTERHLSRLRREHLLEAAELILAQAS